MLGAGRYLLGVAELAVLAGFATLGAARVRARLLPDFGGAPALLATAVIALAVLTLVAEALGSFGLFEAVPYLVGVAVAGLGMWAIGPRVLSRGKGGRCGRGVLDPPFPRATRGREVTHPLRESGVVATGLASLVVVAAVVHFAAGVRLRLSTGMTGFDSTWYHGPLAVEFFQTGNTFELHFLAPQYLAWFYPANAELFHAMGMLAFHRDILSPLLNFGWFLGCLFAGVVHWAGLPGRGGVAGAGRDRVERAGAWGSGRGGSERPRRDLLPACRRCGRRQRLGGAAGSAALDGGARGGRAGGGACRGDEA